MARLTLGVGGALERHVGEAAAVRLQGDVWPAGGFGVASLGARWRWSRDGADRLLASVTAIVASQDAPRALWSGAGTGHARPLLLRAHPLLDDGVITGDAFGRRLLHAGVEGRHAPGLARSADACNWRPLSMRPPHPMPIGPRRHWTQASACACASPGEGTLRVDYARGLDDGRQAVSVGWELPWPAWP